MTRQSTCMTSDNPMWDKFIRPKQTRIPIVYNYHPAPQSLAGPEGFARPKGGEIMCKRT